MNIKIKYLKLNVKCEYYLFFLSKTKSSKLKKTLSKVK